MKKISALFLSLVLMGNFIVPTSVFSKIRLNDSVNIIGFLKTLNIVDEGYFENLDQKMSRGEMIELVVDFMDCEAEADAYSVPIQFYDIDEMDDYYKDICYAAANGYCHGTDNGMIRAYDNATVFQAMITFINALGLRSFALLVGVEEGYNVIAKNTGISDGLNYVLNQELTRAAAIQLMYNVLLSKVYEIESVHISDDANYSAVYELRKDTTYLYERFKIYEAEGTVTATPIAYIEGGVTKKGYVSVDSELYSDSNFYAEDLIGQKVDFYVKENLDGTKEIQYVCESDDKNIITAFSNELSEYDKTERSYKYSPKESRKVKTLKLTAFTEFIYNGTPIENISDKLVNPQDGKFAFIDNDDDSKYDYVIIESFTTMLVESINKELGTIYDSAANYTLNYESYGDAVYMFDSDNHALSIEDIEEENVLTVVKGEDVLKIYVSDNIFHDEIRAKSTVDGITYLTLLDDVEYPANNYFNLYSLYGQDIGQNGDFYIDTFGRIIYVKNSFYSNLGYILKIYSDEDSEDSAKLKLLNIYGKTEVMNLSQKVKIDGVRCNSYEDIVFQLSGIVRDDEGGITSTGLKNNIIIYELNKENEVSSIETAYDFNNTTGDLEKELTNGEIQSKADGLHMSYQLNDITYNGLRSFDGKGLMSSAAKVFVIPINSAGEIVLDNNEFFDVQSTGYFSKWSKYTGNQYKIDKESQGADVIVVFENVELNNVSGATSVMCVSKVVDIWSENEGIAKQITGYVLGNEVTYVTRSSDIGEGIECGDMIKITLDSGQRIKAVEKAYDASANQMLSETSSFANSFRVLVRPVYKIRGKSVITAEKEELPQIVNENDYEGFFIDSGIPVYKFDKTVKTVRRADLTEIVTYEQNPDEYSNLFLYMTSGNIKMAVIYD